MRYQKLDGVRFVRYWLSVVSFLPVRLKRHMLVLPPLCLRQRARSPWNPACRWSYFGEKSGSLELPAPNALPVGTAAPIGSAVTLDQRDCHFDPHVLTVQAGQTLIVRNSDNTLENVHAFTQVNAPFNIGLPVPMATSHIFDKPEAQIPIRDDIHRWKVAHVGVFDHPYHTVSKAGGLYELRLPAGSYEITAWHEKYGKFQQPVVVKSGENPTLDFVYNLP